MRTRTLSVLALTSFVACLSGCALGAPDPLLYGEDGLLRESIGVDEVEAAGIPWGCDGLDDDLLDSLEQVRIPITTSGGPVLVGVGGFAFCVDDEEPEGDDGEPLPEYEPEEPTGLNEGQALPQDDGEPEEDEEDDDTGTIDPSTNLGLLDPAKGAGGGTGSRPMSLNADPTPQPIGD